MPHDSGVDPSNDFTSSFSDLTVSQSFSTADLQQTSSHDYSGHEAASSTWPTEQAFPGTTDTATDTTGTSTTDFGYPDPSAALNMHRTTDYSSQIDPSLDEYYYAQASSGAAAAGPSTQPMAGTSGYLELAEQTNEQGADDASLTDPETAALKPYKCPNCNNKRYRLQCELE